MLKSVLGYFDVYTEVLAHTKQKMHKVICSSITLITPFMNELNYVEITSLTVTTGNLIFNQIL